MTMFVIRHKFVNHLFLQEVVNVDDGYLPIWRSLEVAMHLNFEAAQYLVKLFNTDDMVILPVHIEDSEGDLFNGNSLFDDSRSIKFINTR